MQELWVQVTGGVQGVGFRYFVRMAAEELGITGFVQNQRDGSVQIVAQGDKKKLGEFVTRIRTGNSWSVISDMVLDWKKPTTFFPGFEIRY